MKKTLSLILMFLLVMTLAGCDLIKKSFVVKFIVSNEEVSTTTVKQSSKIPLESYPAITQGELEDWYKDEAFTDRWLKESDKVSENMNLYGKLVEENKVAVNTIDMIGSKLIFTSDHDHFRLMIEDEQPIKLDAFEFDFTSYLDVLNNKSVILQALDGADQVLTEFVLDINYYESIGEEVTLMIDFEGASKTGYASGETFSNGTRLTLNQALIGLSNDDRKVDQRAVRIRKDGKLVIHEPIKSYSSFSFLAGTFGNNIEGTLEVVLVNELGNLEIPIDTYHVHGDLIQIEALVPKEIETLHQNETFFLAFKAIEGDRINIDQVIFYQVQPSYYSVSILKNEEPIEYLSYYDGIQGLSGETLLLKLREIITPMTAVSYGDARYALAHTDLDPDDNFESVRGMYNGSKIATYWIGKGEGAWQREHVWPNSKLGIERVSNSTRNQGTDLHNLRAIDGINQTRSNRYFVEGEGSAVTVGPDAFYPGDQDKGDVARILFYMVVRYEFLNLTSNTNHLVNNTKTNYQLTGAFQGTLEQLFKWHKEDPVDDFEVRRNNEIYASTHTSVKSQGNRNPFIDNPSLFENIYQYLVSKDQQQFRVSYYDLLPKHIYLERKAYNIFES